MRTFEEAQIEAAYFSDLHSEKWIVMETSKDAPSNQYPNNIYNTGCYIAVPQSEALEYVSGGCRVADWMR